MMRKTPTIRRKKFDELEKYKKAVKTREILIDELKDDIAGQYQVIQILSAYIAVLFGDGEHVINKEQIYRAIGKYFAAMKVSDDGESIIINICEIQKKVSETE